MVLGLLRDFIFWLVVEMWDGIHSIPLSPNTSVPSVSTERGLLGCHVGRPSGQASLQVEMVLEGW
jgi:hypothetical protein